MIYVGSGMMYATSKGWECSFQKEEVEAILAGMVVVVEFGLCFVPVHVCSFLFPNLFCRVTICDYSVMDDACDKLTVQV